MTIRHHISSFGQNSFLVLYLFNNLSLIIQLLFVFFKHFHRHGHMRLIQSIRVTLFNTCKMLPIRKITSANILIRIALTQFQIFFILLLVILLVLFPGVRFPRFMLSYQVLVHSQIIYVLLFLSIILFFY
jgi:hypothetical protein